MQMSAPIQVYDSLEYRLLKAKKEVWISGNDCKFVAETQSGFIDTILNKGISVKICCVDYRSEAVEMLTKIDPRFPNAASFINSMQSVEIVLKDFQKRYPDNFEFSYLPILPSLGMFFVDPYESNGFIKFELYTAKPWLPITSRPHFILNNRVSMWRSYFIQQWINYWALSNVQ